MDQGASIFIFPEAGTARRRQVCDPLHSPIISVCHSSPLLVHACRCSVSASVFPVSVPLFFIWICSYVIFVCLWLGSSSLSLSPSLPLLLLVKYHSLCSKVSLSLSQSPCVCHTLALHLSLSESICLHRVCRAEINILQPTGAHGGSPGVRPSLRKRHPSGACGMLLQRRVFASVALYVNQGLSFYPSVCPSVYLFIHLSTCLSVYLVYLSAYLSYLFIYLSTYLPIYPSIHPPELPAHF